MLRGSFTVPHTVYYALKTPPGDGPWPLLLCLHGFGQSAEEFARLLSPLAEQGILVAAPQAPHHFYLNLERRKVGFTWLTRYERDATMRDNVVYLERFYQTVCDLTAVDLDRVSLLGFSQGVSIAYRLWQQSRLPIRKIYACGSDLPPDVEQKLALHDPIAVRLLHGTHDRLVPIEKAVYAESRLRSHGYDVTLTTFDCGHLISPRMLRFVADDAASPRTSNC